jgi:hypothetical protein
MRQVWEKEIPKTDLELYKKRHKILSTRLFAGKLFIRVFSKKVPEKGFYPGDITLEDVYFYYLKKYN